MKDDMIEFIAQAHDPNVFGPKKPVTDQFKVWAKSREEAAKIASSMARERAGGSFRTVTIMTTGETWTGSPSARGI